MLDTIERPPIVELAGDGDEALKRFVVVVENLAIKFFCVFYLNAEDEQDCRKIALQWMLETNHGIPTKCTIVPISDEVEDFNMSSNDDDVIEFLNLS